MVTRRGFLAGLGSAPLVFRFDPATRRWISVAQSGSLRLPASLHRVALRGQGHTTSGQSQVDGGLVIDMATIHEIYSVSAARADVGAGLTWKQLVTTSVPLGGWPRARHAFALRAPSRCQSYRWAFQRFETFLKFQHFKRAVPRATMEGSVRGSLAVMRKQSHWGEDS